MNYISRIQNAINYIEENLTEDISIEQLSRVACFSTSHFKKLFKVAAGVAVKEYLRKRRLSAALMDLKLTDKKIIKIAFDYQYETPEAFTRAFFARYGINPADYRNGSKVLNTFQKIELNSHIIPDQSKTKKDSKMNNEIKIVPYSHDYADAVAEMWREMSGTAELRGLVTSKSKEQVMDEENSSEFLELFLALRDEKVVGYCKLQIDTDHDDLLYIHPFYGTAKEANQPLLTAALQKTIELGYERLDIYSKLIGKVSCRPFGFMRKFDHTSPGHSNFLPLFAKTELIEELFGRFDPLEDSTRAIAGKADIAYGSQENYFTYSWKKGGDELAVQIDGIGQTGIKKIETAEYWAELTLKNPQVIYDQPNEAVFTIRNKSGQPLKAVLKNLKNSHLDYSLDKTADIEEELTVRCPFIVKKSGGKATNLAINLQLDGKSALFSLGSEPLPALSISAKEEKSLYIEGNEYRFNLVLENNLDQAVEATFKLPKEEALLFTQYEYHLQLSAREKLVLPVEFKLLSATIWRTALKFKVRCADSTVYKLEKSLGLTMPTLNGIYYSGGEATIGKYRLLLSNNGFASWLDEVTRFDQRSGLRDQYIWFGSCEFVRVGNSKLLLNNQPDSVDFEQESTAVIIRRTYSLRDSNRLKVVEIFNITTNGIIKRRFEIKNNSTKEITEPVTIYNHFFINFYNWIIPYQNRFVALNEEIQNEVAFWNSADFTENWLFANKTGACWPAGDKFIFNTYYPYFGIEQTTAGIRAGAVHSFEAVTGADNTYEDWHSFREFALQKKLDKAELTDSLNLTINQGNPFAADKVIFQIEEIKNQVNDNTLRVRLNNTEVNGLQKISAADNCQTYQLKHTLNHQEITVIDAVLNNSRVEKQFTKAMFPQGKSAVKPQITTEEGCRVFTAGNGLIQIKASPDFAPVLYSCVFNGVECFDNSFPEVISKDFFGDWAGGASYFPTTWTSQNLLFHEQYEVVFASLTDNFGNQWSGIKIIIRCEKFPPLEGVTIERYFLMLPQSPVLHIFTVMQGGCNGKISYDCYSSDIFLNPELGKGDSYFVFKDKNGRHNKVKCGVNNYEIFTSDLVSYEFDEAPFKIAVNHSGGPYSAHGICDFSYGYHQSVPENQPIQQQFLIFTNQDLETEWLKDLDNIRFEL